jgi:large subunit ribosomal protein L21
MFAVIKTGGKQYRVAAGDTITVEKLDGEAGDVVAFDQVLMLVDGETTTVGAPAVEGVTVAGEVVEQTRGAKVIAFKKRRRKNSRRKRGHRQHLSVVRITDVLTGGAKPAARAKAAEPAPEIKAEAQPAVEAAPAAEAPKAKRSRAKAADSETSEAKPKAKPMAKPAKDQQD